MKVLPENQLNGDIVNLKVTKRNHLSGQELKSPKNDAVTESFADLFNKALNQANELELKSNELTTQMTINPESVNVHDVQIAGEEAEMAILFTKGVLDRVIRAYKEIINLR